jgi:signal transduction histidine kinase
MTIHEISPKQLRAFLFLLVLVPFIPLVLMLRFMLDALEGENDAARERLAAITQRTLSSAAVLEEKHLTGETGPILPEDLRRVCLAVFDRTMEIRVRDTDELLAAGPAQPEGQRVAEATIKHDRRTWTVEAWLVDDSALKREVGEAFKVYAWTALIAAVAICTIAAVAGLAVNQQLRLNELKNNSVALVAHELRTPLATMRVLVDTLREGRCRNSEQMKEYLDLLHAENLRLSRLTEHFLTHSRLARGQQAFAFAPVPVQAVIDPAVAALHAKLEAPGCQFTLDLARPLPEIVADRDSLVTVLINLLDNALKYSGDEKRISLRARREGDVLVFTVEDNGVGFTTAERHRIFEPFYQVDQKLSRIREGCGLGLSIVQAIVSAHRGRIEIESEPGQGAAFAVRIPLSPA